MLNRTAVISPALSKQCVAANHFSSRQRHQSKKNGSALKPWLDICWDKALIVMCLSASLLCAFIPLLILYTLLRLHCRPLGLEHYKATVIWSTPTFNQPRCPQEGKVFVSMKISDVLWWCSKCEALYRRAKQVWKYCTLKIRKYSLTTFIEESTELYSVRTVIFHLCLNRTASLRFTISSTGESLPQGGSFCRRFK